MVNQFQLSTINIIILLAVVLDMLLQLCKSE